MRIERRKRDFELISASDTGGFDPLIRTTVVIREVIAVILIVCATAAAVLLVRW